MFVAWKERSGGRENEVIKENIVNDEARFWEGLEEKGSGGTSFEKEETTYLFWDRIFVKGQEYKLALRLNGG